MLQEMLKSRVEPIHQLALKSENSRIIDDAHLQQVLSTMLRNSLIGAINPGTGGAMATIGSSIGFMRITVRGRPVTPDVVVMDMFWELLSIMYAASQHVTV
jgi:hypothetical protein